MGPLTGIDPGGPQLRFSPPAPRKHEWEKHGTCAAQLDALDSQRKYFGKGLDLYKALALNR